MAKSEKAFAIRSDPKVFIVRPPKKGFSFGLSELWIYRELVYFMIWRNIKVRYKQTVLGFAWAILRPFLSMVVFSIFFGNFAKVPSDNIPYPIFSYAALLPWELLSMAVTTASSSIVANAHMVTKVYFPRMILPISQVLSGLVDFGIAFFVLIGMMLFYHIRIRLTILFLPLFIIFTLITALAVGLWLSALDVMYRDIGYLLPFINQIWLFISPIAYAASIVPGKWQLIYAINPMKGIADGFRWALLGTAAPSPTIWISVGVSVLLLISGMIFFKRLEKNFADLI